MKTTSPIQQLDDASLVTLSRDGDRDAFGQIVERYQSLICALTYSACGNLQSSEDLAQVTFITAWCQLKKLQEPSRLKAWLCGIARNVANNSFRRDARTPTARGENLDMVGEISSPAPTPRDNIISKEEEAILWRSLGDLPTIYREPLVLFYRQHQSVAEVAAALDVSEDVVRQRLSRGRTMLTEKVTAFIEGALQQTIPGPAFTLSVMGALPVLTASAKVAAMGAVATKGSASAKAAGLLGLGSALLGPLLVIFGNYAGYRASLDSAQTDLERDYIKRFYKVLVWFLTTFFVASGLTMLVAWQYLHAHHLLVETVIVALMVAFLATIVALTVWTNRTRRKLIVELKNTGLLNKPVRPVYEYRSQAQLLEIPLVHIRFGGGIAAEQTPVKAWIAAGDRAVGLLVAFGGLAIAPISIGGVAIGLLPFGGCALGVLALGGCSVGWWAFGGIALGWQTFGGLAVAWNAAIGGFAMAREYALGGAAHAVQANNKVAQQFMESSVFFRNAMIFSRHSIWANALWIIPLVAWWRAAARQRKASNS